MVVTVNFSHIKFTCQLAMYMFIIIYLFFVNRSV